jgi:hypothetical protein
MSMMQTTSDHPLWPAARVAKEHVSFNPAEMYFHVLSKRIDLDIKSLPRTIDALGDRLLQSWNCSVVKSVWNFVLVQLIERNRKESRGISFGQNISGKKETNFVVIKMVRLLEEISINKRGNRFPLNFTFFW